MSNYKRVLTYDLNGGSSADYKELYDLLDKYNAVKLTESSYFISTHDTYEIFKSKFLKVTTNKDTVFAIVIADGTLNHWKIR